MIIKDPSKLDHRVGPHHGIVGIESKKDKLHIKHVELLEPTLAAVDSIKRNSDNGFTDERTMQHLCRIPGTDFERITKEEGNGWWTNHRRFQKYLRSDGSRYRIARNP